MTEFQELRRGELLHTRTTARWSDAERRSAQLMEQTQIFTHFLNHDQGRSRMRLCTMNAAHPDWQEYADFLVRACNAHDGLLAACKDLMNAIEWAGDTLSAVERARAVLAKAAEQE